MNNLIYLFIFLTLHVLGDPLLDIDRCKTETNESICAAKVVLKEVLKLTPSSSGSNIYCLCIKSGVAGKVHLILKKDGELLETIAEDLTPHECVEALKFHPCN